LKSPAFLLVTFFVCLFSSAPSVLAQQAGPPPENRVSFARAGVFLGRTGSALGSGAYVEVNPIRWVGVCAFAAHSRATFVTEGKPVQDWDSTIGVCVTSHLPMWKGFLISPFLQMAYQSDHDRVDIPLGNGATYRYEQNQMYRLWTAGPSIDRAIVKDGPRWQVRIGENFGNGPAVKRAGGVYAVGGVIFPLDHPVKLGRSFKRMIGLKPKTAPSPNPMI
jgi:hypothetical protein